MSDEPPILCFCHACGHELRPWFDTSKRIYDTREDDAAFAAWRTAPCPQCGASPADATSSSARTVI